MDTVFLALRVVVALGAVFGALLFTHRWITKGRPGSQPRNRQIAIVARQGLGAKAGIAVVDAGGRRYLLGVTEHAVTVLDTLGPAEAPVAEASLVASQPISLPTAAVRVERFEQALRTVTITTTDVPVVVHGGTHPIAVNAQGGQSTQAGQGMQTIAIRPAWEAGEDTSADRRGPVSFSSPVSFSGPPTAGVPVYPSRRAMRAAENLAAENLASEHHAAATEDVASREAVASQAAAQQQRSGVQRPDAQRPDTQRTGAQRPGSSAGPLAGSVLSPATWRQTVDALKKLR